MCSPLEVPWMLEHGLLIRQSLRNRSAAIPSGDSTHPVEGQPHTCCKLQRRCVADAWPSFSHPDLADPSLVLRCGLSSQMRQPAIPRFTLVELGADTGRIGAIPRTRLSPVGMVETNRWPCSSAARLFCGGGCLPLFCADGRSPSAGNRGMREDPPCQL